MEPNIIHIVFDGEPGPIPGRFIDVETPEGKSINVGRWEQHGKFWHFILSPFLPDDNLMRQIRELKSLCAAKVDLVETWRTSSEKWRQKCRSEQRLVDRIKTELDQFLDKIGIGQLSPNARERIQIIRDMQAENSKGSSEGAPPGSLLHKDVDFLKADIDRLKKLHLIMKGKLISHFRDHAKLEEDIFETCMEQHDAMPPC